MKNNNLTIYTLTIGGNEYRVTSTEELENKKEQLEIQFLNDVAEAILNSHQCTISVNAVLDDTTFEIVDYEYSWHGNNEYNIYRDGYARINVFYQTLNGFGHDEWYDECIRIWCDNHNIKYYDEETETHYDNYDRDEVAEIFKEMFLDDYYYENNFEDEFQLFINNKIECERYSYY